MLNGQPHPQHELCDFEATMRRLAPLFSRLAPARFGLQQVVYDLVWRGMVKLDQALIVTNPAGARAMWPLDYQPHSCMERMPPNLLVLGTVIYPLENPTMLPRLS